MNRTWRRFYTHRLALAGLSVIAAFVLIALLAPWLAPNDPIRQSLPDSLQSPSLRFPLGTDEFGRCVLSRIV
ncbi:MAG: glutathione ABC transporter permease GsiD, partial [Candidatus Rokubacteria bacterium]|nr:glutathione ABC transporter permease GsiD [Candidatus Rokubacteria bacterium]